MWIWIHVNWERCFLFFISVVFLSFSVGFFLRTEVAAATAAFVMFFLCLIYANVSRFKRFKGLGFEAELWEDKQKEAADLIDRLKNIVQVYTREIVTMKVMSGRFGGGAEWNDRWALYEELVGQHDTLGQRIDFQPLKEKVYKVMVFDAVSYTWRGIQQALDAARNQARSAIATEFGSPIQDVTAHSKRIAELNAISYQVENLFEVSANGNAARYTFDLADRAAKSFFEKFGVEVIFPDGALAKLQKIDALVQSGDFRIDPELVRWADRES